MWTRPQRGNGASGILSCRISSAYVYYARPNYYYPRRLVAWRLLVWFEGTSDALPWHSSVCLGVTWLRWAQTSAERSLYALSER